MGEYEKRGYLLENFRLFHLNSRGGTQVEYHYHEFCKILLLVSGQGGYFVDGQRYLLQPGDIVLLDSDYTVQKTFVGGEWTTVEAPITNNILSIERPVSVDLVAAYNESSMTEIMTKESVKLIANNKKAYHDFFSKHNQILPT